MSGIENSVVKKDKQPEVMHFADFGGSWVAVIGANSKEEAMRATQEALANLSKEEGGDDERIKARLTPLSLGGDLNPEILTYGINDIRSNMVFTQIKKVNRDGEDKWIFG